MVVVDVRGIKHRRRAHKDVLVTSGAIQIPGAGQDIPAGSLGLRAVETIVIMPQGTTNHISGSVNDPGQVGNVVSVAALFNGSGPMGSPSGGNPLGYYIATGW